MKLKQCSCGKTLTTKNTKYIGRQIMPKRTLLLFNCPSCGSTNCVADKRTESEFNKLNHGTC